MGFKLSGLGCGCLGLIGCGVSVLGLGVLGLGLGFAASSLGYRFSGFKALGL